MTPSLNVNHWPGHRVILYGISISSSLTQTHFKWLSGDSSVTDTSWIRKCVLVHAWNARGLV